MRPSRLMPYAVLFLLVPGIAPAEITKKTACDFTEIEDFIGWFAGSAENQQEASLDPLPAAFYEKTAKGEVLLEPLPHQREELGWPILPKLKHLYSTGYRIEYSRLSADEVDLRTRGGMSVDMTYTFKREPCWTLVKLVDATP